MMRLALFFSFAASMLLTASAYAADPQAPDATLASAQAPAADAAPASCGNVPDFFETSCPLTWRGVTLYGTLDMGVTWQSHGTPLNGESPPGVEYLLSKNSNRSGFYPAPDGLTQSNIGVKGKEDFAPGWSFIFDLELGFDPYSLRLANGPGAIAENAGVPLTNQSSNTDSSRAGQFYNALGYLGAASTTYGTLTVFRQNSLTLDGVFAYDPLGGSYAFSPIGYQGTTCGVGDTEDCRYTTAVKYRVNVGQFRAAALWQFGGYSLNNAANGAYQFGIGADIPAGPGKVSLDGIYSYVKDAVLLSLEGNTLPAVLPQILTATLSNDMSLMLLTKYARQPVTLYGGYEWIDFADPSDPENAFTDIAGNRLCLHCAALDNTDIVNNAFLAHHKQLQIFWVGVKYAVTGNINVMAGYYQYLQNSYGAGPPCNNSSKPTCSGMYNAVSVAVDWQFAAKFDTYAGLMYQTVSAGLANGFLHNETIDPTVGLRFRF